MGTITALDGAKRRQAGVRSVPEAPKPPTPAVICVRVADVMPNPFRDVGRYPPDSSKVEALRESIRTTGVWPNVVGRRRTEGTYEVAYGHHRLEAVRQELGEDAPFPLTIEDLSDEDMLKMMVRENMQERETSALDDQASVRAVVEAYAAGKIGLNPPHPKSPKHKLRHAPSFVQGDVPGGAREDRPYTATTLMPMLGWPRDKIENTLGALEIIQGGFLRESHFARLSPTQGICLAHHVRRYVRTLMAQANEREKDAHDATKKAAKATEDRLRQEYERQAEVLGQAATRARQQAMDQAEQIANTLLAFEAFTGFDAKGIKVVAEALHPKDVTRQYEDDEGYVWECRSAALTGFAHAVRRFVNQTKAVTWPHGQRGVLDPLRVDEHPLVLTLAAEVRSALDALEAKVKGGSRAYGDQTAPTS